MLRKYFCVTNGIESEMTSRFGLLLTAMVKAKKKKVFIAKYTTFYAKMNFDP